MKIVAADRVDHVQEAKFDGEWKIVNVLCELNPKPACERGARDGRDASRWSTEIVIHRPRTVVAEYAADPDNAPNLYVNIKSIEWKTPRPLAVGSRLAFVAQFLGRRMAYTYEIVTFLPEERLVMQTAEGPFPMETQYTWESTADGGTRMTLRNSGEPRGLSKLVGPLMARAIRHANQKDLRRLKQILESKPN